RGSIPVSGREFQKYDLRAVEENWVQIRNEVLATLRSSGPEDLKGEAGMQRLRQQIIERANAILDEAEVTDVFFVKMIVQ
ncbi:MAG: flagellar basal body-associated FliL family protein, partial [Bacillota bacterium]